MHHLISDIGIAIIVATVAGYLFLKMRQPIILAYFLAGVIIGPEIGPPLVIDHESIEIISEIGLILLLFIIGLEMNPEKVLSVLGRLVPAGIGQFLFTVVGAFALFSVTANLISFHKMEILYVSIAISLSSTAIVIKSLHDKYELDSIAGRLSLGVLIFQDIWAILVIVLQPRFDNPSLIPVLLALFRVALLVLGGLLFSRYVLKYVFESITKSPEMIVSIALGWSALFAGVAHSIGLSMEMGALIAGVSIASFPFSMHVTMRIQPLRDFFLTLFFISLGMKMTVPGHDHFYLVPLIILVAFLSRFLILYPLLRVSGSSRRNAFIASLNLSQISEFSLVIVAIGISLGHVGGEFMSVMIYAMAISAILSSYGIRYNNQIYRFLERFWKPKRRKDEQSDGKTVGNTGERDIYILGFHRGARALLDYLQEENPQCLKRIVVVDYNQEVVRELAGRGISCVYGDISHEDVLEHTGIGDAKYILSTIPDLLLRGTSNIDLVRVCRKLNREAYIIATADLKNSIHPMKVAGANYVVLPYSLLAQNIAGLFISGKDEEAVPIPL